MSGVLKRLAMPFLLVVYSFTILLPLCVPSVVQAQTAGQGLEISPPLVDLKADPGKTLTERIKIRNVTAETLVVRAQYNDFVASGEEGLPKLLLDNNESNPFSIKDWLSSIANLSLAPKEQKTITLTINVPGDASPGGHYGVIRFTGSPPDTDESAVSLSASIGTLVLVNVSGDIKEEANIVELYAAQKDKKRSLFEYGPIQIVARVENIGNIHIQPTGVVRVTNMFGREIGSSQLNQNKGNVLPESIRKFESTLDKKLLFGRYTIQADLVYGAEGKIITKTRSFWVIPYKLILLALGLIILLYFAVRGYNRTILKRASKRQNSHGKTSKKRRW